MRSRRNNTLRNILLIKANSFFISLLPSTDFGSDIAPTLLSLLARLLKAAEAFIRIEPRFEKFHESIPRARGVVQELGFYAKKKKRSKRNVWTRESENSKHTFVAAGPPRAHN